MAEFGGITVARWGALATGNGGLPSAGEWPMVLAVLVGIALLGTLALRFVGLSWIESAVVAALSPAVVLVDVPLGEGASGVRLFANAAGCLLPVAIAIAVLATRRVPWVTAFVLLAAATALALVFSWVVPARGVLLDYRACALGVGLVAAALSHDSPRQAGALAFAGAAIGTTIGADLLRLDDLMSLPRATAITLGGAGLLDGILLTSLVACIVASASAAGVQMVSRVAHRAGTPARA